MAAADAAQQLTVTAANAYRDSVYNLTLSGAGLINGTQTVNTDGANHGAFDALVWVPNSFTSTLDLIVADATKGQIVRYSGPNYGISSTIFSWTTQGSGPAHPVGLTADAAGNVYVISPSCAWDATPSLWVLPFIAATGTYGAPVLIDHSFGGVRTLALAEVLVAGTAASANGSAAPAWNAGDLLVLVGDTFNSRVIVYSQAAINGVIANPNQPLTGPTSTAVSQSQFQNLLAVPFGMDIWPADATHGVALLFTTIDGRIIRFDSGQAAFAGNFASGLGLGLQKLKVGSFSSTPYAFAARVTLPTGGAILQFGTPPASGANNPLATVSSGVSDPIGLAVTSSDSTPAANCVAPSSCNFLGGAVALQISGPGAANIPPGAGILDQSCVVPADPRVTISNGAWSCLGPQINVCSGTQTTNCVSPTLDVANYCPGFPHTVLPASLCGHSGPTGAGFAVVKGTAVTVDENINNTFPQTTVDPSVSLPGPNNLTCAQNPIFAWAPRSDLPAVEGTVPEDLALPNTFIDLSGYCDKGGGTTKLLSMYAYGLGLNTAASGLGSGPTGGLFGFVTAKFTNLSSTIAAAAPQIDPTVAATLQGYVTQSQTYFNSSYQNDVPNGYSCALNSLASADSYLRAHLSGFSYAQPPAGNPNPAGDVDGRLANLFLAINTYFFMQPPNTTWPTTNVPPCVKLTASPASVTQGSAAALTWGAATPTYPLAFPPAQCSLSASDGAFTTPATVGPSGTSVSTGNLTLLGTYTAALECTGAGGATVQGVATTVLTGLASTSVSVIPPPVLTSISLSPLSASIGDLFNQQFTAIGTYSYGPTQDVTNAVAWSSSNPAIATIGAGGSAFCQTTGSVTVTAILGGVQASASLTCLSVVSNLGLFVPGGVTTLLVGGTVQLTAQAAYTVGPPANVNATATWVSTNPAVATVSNGLVTAVSPGQVNIYATVNDPIAGLITSPMAAFTVTAPVTLQSLSLHPSSPLTLQLECPVQILVYGNYSNGTTQNLTAAATWTSSNPKVATVSGGLVKPLCKGTTTIYAAYGGVPAASLVVTVKGGY
jgi:uncharacterized protein YjdB